MFGCSHFFSNWERNFAIRNTFTYFYIGYGLSTNWGGVILHGTPRHRTTGSYDGLIWIGELYRVIIYTNIRSLRLVYSFATHQWGGRLYITVHFSRKFGRYRSIYVKGVGVGRGGVGVFGNGRFYHHFSIMAVVGTMYGTLRTTGGYITGDFFVFGGWGVRCISPGEILTLRCLCCDVGRNLPTRWVFQDGQLCVR